MIGLEGLAVEPCSSVITLYNTFQTLRKKPIENNVGKGTTQCWLPAFFPFPKVTFNLSSAIVSSLDEANVIWYRGDVILG